MRASISTPREVCNAAKVAQASSLAIYAETCAISQSPEMNRSDQASQRLALLFLLRQRQKFLAGDFAVFDGVDSDLGHLHSFLRGVLGYIDIELHDEGVPGYKWSADFCAVDFDIFLPQRRVAAHPIDAADFCGHAVPRSCLHADDVSRAGFGRPLPPGAIERTRTP